jgi:hypothetical protein
MGQRAWGRGGRERERGQAAGRHTGELLKFFIYKINGTKFVIM